MFHQRHDALLVDLAAQAKAGFSKVEEEWEKSVVAYTDADIDTNALNQINNKKNYAQKQLPTLMAYSYRNGLCFADPVSDRRERYGC
jgi:hypothetical protein